MDLFFFAALVLADPCIDYAPDTFTAIITTTKGPFNVSVTRDWAENSADRFWNALKCGQYTTDEFFWVVANSWVQFGLNGDPSMNSQWTNLTSDIPTQKNAAGYVSFYAPDGYNSGSTEVIINLGDNPDFDAAGYAPFGLVDSDGLQVVQKLYSGYGTQPSEDMIKTEGNSYLTSNFPLLDAITAVDVHVVCPRTEITCQYEDGNDFAIQCCSGGEQCIQGVGCRCLKGAFCAEKDHS